jgi:hypothetical protein
MRREFHPSWLACGLGFTALVLLAGHGWSETPFRFVVWNDSASGTQYVSAISAQIRQLSVQPSFSIFPGDIYETGYNPADAEALRWAMDGGRSNGLSGTWFPVRGNHDKDGDIPGWQSYLDIGKRVSGGDSAKGVPGIGGRNYTFMTNCDSLTYSFDYERSHFVGVDVPGSITGIKTDQLSWLDSDLAAAEARGLEHAFLWWHGPVMACGKHCCINAPATLIAVLNKHSIVSAVFGGHDHVFAWTHISSNRLAGVTHPFEAFITAACGESSYATVDTSRCEFGLPGVRGFSTVDVSGPSFTVAFYAQGDPLPRFTRTFRAGTWLNSPALTANGRFKFTLMGEPGSRYLIEASTDLGGWTVLSTNTVNSPTGTEIQELTPTNSPRQFYRCRPVP